jgi:tyrosyl-tRNA synthetase
MTFPLLTTSSGAKMGKTAAGAVWLEPSLFSPYDFFQYWVNCDDRDVGRFLRIYTLLPLDEIRRLEVLRDSEINAAKRVLAFEATKLTHGEAAALEARAGAAAAFGGGAEMDVASIPTTRIPRARLDAGIPPAELFTEVGLTPSRGEAKRLIKQGGLYVNDRRLDAVDQPLTLADAGPDGLLLKAGKKKIHRVVPG